MTRRGLLALFVYIFGLLGSVGMAIYAAIEADRISETGGENWEGLGVAFLLIFSIIIAIPYAIQLIVKILHLITTWKFFAVVCILADIAIILFWSGVPELITDGFSAWQNSWAYENLILIIPSAAAMIANITSLTD